MNRKRRKDSFFGLHFDFHADPKQVTNPVGSRLTEDMVREICKTIQPDFIQVDCKGHPGWASYPSKLGNAVQPMEGDPLKIWRKVTAECGVSLYVHYSGVRDAKYAAEHPEEARITADGTPHELTASVFGRYADDLLIPQMLELAGEYGVDGAWVDGECWGTDTDYGPRALEAFYKETGVDLRDHPPVSPEMPYYREYRDFCREAFRNYLRHYVDTVHAAYPDFQIASNWAFADHMPEAVCANVDFISGDLAPQDSFNAARYCGRILAAQKMPWDLIAWNFRSNVPSMEEIQTPKHPEQIKQEAAAVISLGGGFQNYILQFSDGTPRMNQIRPMKEVAAFCRARQPWCQHGKLVPQAAIFFSKYDHYLNTKRLFHNSKTEGLRGWTQLLCETQQSVEIRSEHNFRNEESDRFPMAVVADLLTGLEEESAQQLLAYAKNGGSLVISGRKALEALIAAGAPFTVEDSGYEGGSYFTTDRETWGSCNLNVPKLGCVGGEVLAWACRDVSGDRAEVYPMAAWKPFGKGKIFAISADIGRAYYAGSTAEARRLLRTVEDLAYDPMVRVSGSMYCDVTVLKKDDMLCIQLVNSCGGHEDIQKLSIDEIPPIGPLQISIALPKAPKQVMLRPEGKELTGTYRNGRFETEVTRLNDIHQIVTVEV